MANKKQIGAVLMASALAVTAACSSGGDSKEAAKESAQASAKPSASPAASASAKPSDRPVVKISAGTEVRKSTFPIPSLVHKQIEKKFNVQFEPIATWINADTETKLSVQFASGNYPEALLHINNPNFVKNLGRQGYLLPMNKYLDKLPNYTKLFSKEEWEMVMQEAANEDGNLYYLPIKNYRTHSMAWIYRKDVFDSMGLAFPATLDELYTVLKKLKEKFPNSVPMSNRGGVDGLLNGINTALRVSGDIYADPDKNDEIVYGPMTDKYRQGLIFANKLYKENLVEKEFATITYDQWLERHYSDRTYIEFSYGTRSLDFNTESKDIKGVNWNWSPKMVGANGKPGLAVRELPFYTYGPVLTNKIKGDALDRMLEYYNWAVTPEGTRLHEWGVEGETYKLENGKPKFMDVIDKDTNKTDKMLEFGLDYLLNRDNDMIQLSPSSKIDMEVSAAFASAPNAKQLFFNWTEELGKQRAKLKTNIDDLKAQYIVKFVMGQLDPNNDADWNKFIGDLNKAGIVQYVDLHKQAAKK
ncbi:extracellular solute-binding protein [Paenibacillus cymbidii]|uniref:extracellular solute-binding protein n=1 Tax=Paenibacillus cymbidii TaxID=1639034 RepID=UPI00107FD93A|nr:extracellular solute-binding protein [Paenibacillus cymbidii]